MSLGYFSPKQLKLSVFSPPPSSVFPRLHRLTLAFSTDSMLFSGWSRFTMIWMPARDSLPSHYVSVYWLPLKNRIFNDRYSGLRVVGMLTFHHLCDLLSVEVSADFHSPLILGSVLLVQTLLRMTDRTVQIFRRKYLSDWHRLEWRQSRMGWVGAAALKLCRSKQAKLLCLSLFSLLTSSCPGASQVHTWKYWGICPILKRLCQRESACAYGEQGVKGRRTWNRLKKKWEVLRD